MDLTVVIPALDEAGNIGELTRRARAALDQLGLSYEIIVADGGSRDGSAAEAEAAGARVLRRPRAGYAATLLSGLAEAQGEWIATMDADLSHEPEFLAALWSARDGADLVIASRYVSGGAAEMPIWRSALSRALNWTFRGLFRVPARDLSSGYRLYRASALRGIAITGRNFNALPEALIQFYMARREVVEIPFHYRRRRRGRSHASVPALGLAYIKSILYLRRLRAQAGAPRGKR